MLQSSLTIANKNKRDDFKNVVSVSIENIRPNPNQPKKQFNKGSLEELAESIKQYGVMQPITLRYTGNNKYDLVAGERRLRASTIAGLKEIPSFIIEMNDNDSALIALIDDLQREDLTYMEEAEGYNLLITEHGLTQEALAMKIGKSQSTIANKIRLLRLPPLVKKILSDNNLTERHARALLKLQDEQLQLKVLKRVCERGLNVKNTEDLVEKAIEKYVKVDKDKNSDKKVSGSIKDVRIFVNSIRQAIDMMKKSGVNAKAAQLDKGEYYEFIVRVPKKEAV